jgi:mRNA interferase HigB
MHVITRQALKAFWENHPTVENSLSAWYKIVNTAKFSNFVELRQTFPSADQVGKLTVFNISGNNFRLIVLIDYGSQKIFIRYVLTHAAYDTEEWKNDDWYS